MTNQNQLTELIFKFDGIVTELTLPIQIKRDIDESVFERLIKAFNEILIVSKNIELLPKSFIHSIYFTINLIRNEAMYISSGPQKAIDMSNKLEYLLGLLLKGEVAQDRTPGVPRVI